MAEDSTTRPEGSAPTPCRTGDTVVFKYEGNMRARVTGHRLMYGRVWVEARAASLSFLIPASQVVCVEPGEEE